MATVNAIYDYLDQKAPFRYQADFDNAGFLAGHGDREVCRVLVALDVTPGQREEAAREKAAQRRKDRIEREIISTGSQILKGGLLSTLKKRW